LKGGFEDGLVECIIDGSNDGSLLVNKVGTKEGPNRMMGGFFLVTVGGGIRMFLKGLT
jgi:hypothetical protein